MSRFGVNAGWGQPHRPRMNFVQNNQRPPRFNFSHRVTYSQNRQGTQFKGGNSYETNWTNTVKVENAYEESFEQNYNDETFDQNYDYGTFDQNHDNGSYENYEDGTFDQNFTESNDYVYSEEGFDNANEAYQDDGSYQASAEYEYTDLNYGAEQMVTEQQPDDSQYYMEQTQEETWTPQYPVDPTQNYDTTGGGQTQHEGRIYMDTGGFNEGNDFYVRDGGRGGMMSDRNRGGIASGRSRGGMTSGRGRGGMTSDRGRGGMSSDIGRGGMNSYRGRGGITTDRGRGGITSDRGRGGMTSDRGRGGMTSDRGRGGITSDRGRGGMTSDRGRGGMTSDRGRGGMTSDRGRGGMTSDRGRGGMSSDRGRGGMTSDRGRGRITSDRGRGGITSDRGRVGMTSDRGRGGMTSDRGRGGMSSDRGRGGMTSDRGRGGMISDRGRGGMTSDRGRGGMTSDRGRGGMTSDRGRGGMTSDRGRGGVTSERGRGGVTSDRGRSGMTSDRGRGGMTSDRGRGGMTSDRGRGGMTSDRGRGGMTSDRGRGGMTSDRGRGGMTSDRGRGGMTLNQSRGGMSLDIGRGGMTSDRGRGGMTLKQSRDEMTSERGSGGTTLDKDGTTSNNTQVMCNPSSGRDPVSKVDDVNVSGDTDGVGKSSNTSVHISLDKESSNDKLEISKSSPQIDDFKQEDNVGQEPASEDKNSVTAEEMVIVGETDNEFVIAGETEDEILVMEEEDDVSPYKQGLQSEGQKSRGQFGVITENKADSSKCRGQFNMVIDYEYEADKGQFGLALNSGSNVANQHEMPQEGEVKTEELEVDLDIDALGEDTRYCKYCKVSFSSAKTYQNHTQGLRHTTLVMEAKGLKETKTIKKEKVDQSSHVVNKPKPAGETFDVTVSDMIDTEGEGKSEERKLIENKDLNPSDIGKNPFEDSLHCALCHVHCTSATTFKMHIEGKQHKLKLEMAKLGVVTKKKSSELVVHETTDRVSKVNRLIARVRAPIIGLEYITEFQKEDPHGIARYVCNLCESKCDESAIVPHLIGVKHRMKYFEVNDASTHEYLVTFNVRKKRSEISTHIEEYAQKVELEKGRPKVKVKIMKEPGVESQLKVEMVKCSNEISKIVHDIDKGLKPVISQNKAKVREHGQFRDIDKHEPPVKRSRPTPEHQRRRDPEPDRRSYEKDHADPYIRDPYDQYGPDPYRPPPAARPRPIEGRDPHFRGRYPPDPFDDFRVSYRRDFDPYRVDDPYYERRLFDERRRLDDLMLEQHRLEDPYAERRRVDDIMERRRYLNELENDRINDIMDRRRKLQTQDIDYLRLQRFADRDNVSRSPSLSTDEKQRLDSVLARRHALEEISKQPATPVISQDPSTRPQSDVRPSNVTVSNIQTTQSVDNLDASAKQELIVKALFEEFSKHPGVNVQDIMSKLSSTMLALGADTAMAKQMSDTLTQAIIQHGTQNAPKMSSASTTVPPVMEEPQNILPPMTEQAVPEANIPGFGATTSSNVPAFLRSPQVNQSVTTAEYSYSETMPLHEPVSTSISDTQKKDIQSVLAQIGMAPTSSSLPQPPVSSQQWTGTSYNQSAMSQPVYSQQWSGTTYTEQPTTQPYISEQWTGTMYEFGNDPQILQQQTSITHSATTVSSYNQGGQLETQPDRTAQLTGSPHLQTSVTEIGSTSSTSKIAQFQHRQTSSKSQQDLSAAPSSVSQYQHSQTRVSQSYNSQSSTTVQQTNQTEPQVTLKPGAANKQNLLDSIRQQTELLKQKIQSTIFSNKVVSSNTAVTSYPDPYTVPVTKTLHSSTSQSATTSAPSQYSSQYYQQNYKAPPPNSAPQPVPSPLPSQNPYYNPYHGQPPLPNAPPPSSYSHSHNPPLPNALPLSSYSHSHNPPLPNVPPISSYSHSYNPPLPEALPPQPPLPSEQQTYQTNDLPPLRRRR